MCFASVKKAQLKYDLIIIDEAHRSFAPVARKVYDIQCEYLLGLTATPPTNLQHEKDMSKLCPIIYYKTPAEAEKADAIAKSTTLNVKVAWEKGAKNKYDIFHKMFVSANINLINYLNSIGYKKPAFEFARDNNTTNELARKYWSAMVLRRRSVYGNANALNVAIDVIRKHPEKKWLVFTRSIKDAEFIVSALTNARSYHSKNTTKKNSSYLEMFERGEINVIATVDALNEGADIKGADAAIAVSGVSNSLVGIQTLGRIIRKEGDKHAIFINIYSDSVVDKRWVTSRTKELNPVWVESTNDLKQWIG